MTNSRGRSARRWLADFLFTGGKSVKNGQSADAFRQALNNACGEINEAARLSQDLFQGDELNSVLRELARLMATIDSRLLSRLAKS